MAAWSISEGDPLVASVEIKRSRFLAYMARVEDDTQARSFVAHVRHDHPAARHRCSAFRVESHPGEVTDIRERSNDDGEPAGTAGSPILAVLRGADMVNVCVVVVRYFGGIKLGTGGLTRAYRDVVDAVMREAAHHKRLVKRIPSTLWHIPAPFADVGRWESTLRTAGVDIVEVQYGGAPQDPDCDHHLPPTAEAILTVAVDSSRGEKVLHSQVAALSSGQVSAEPGECVVRECVAQPDDPHSGGKVEQR